MKKNKYLKVIKGWNGKTEDLCYDLYILLCSEPNKSKALKMVCEIFEYDEPEEVEYSYFSKVEIDAYRKRFSSLIDETIDAIKCSLCFQEISLDTAYELLWNLVMDNILFKTEKEKVFALFWLLIDESVPFFVFDKPVRLECDDFINICDKHSSKIQKIKYILDLPFEQRTESASLLLDEILTAEDRVERAVLMVHAIVNYADKEMTSNLRKESISRIKEFTEK